MSTVIQIKRSSNTSAPSTLKLGELAYTFGTGTQSNLGDRLFIGSSLGGFYASYFAEKFDSKAVLINPASNPYLGMKMYLGKNTNYSTN